ncbi:1,3-beta-glucanosyltransferase Gel2 [Taphrina deformans PYCC 5710]|uniref:1,3-beta-glucanosyltransferase n=1 Tax=Taphrina deformans (strain PYCC 5710 / ATCC 11124 / CBS 356.35 / IMI 108563 / JCM 9778 / NBRC 8474) TaxID=1097556 RepID=R4XCF1_TAPDE|nr:1,3-beta-glucanosyltransferase Gel2 [Taphrina deformans PYCC 5710]|eukprot:CCG81000.1 1,3-beta-glucanosyltransferase Gel2 [Taphrina deformans PYCC 5710]
MLFTLFSSALSLSAAVSALNPIAVRNNVFYDTSTNKRFFMVGVDYQPGGASAVSAGADPLSDIEICRRDVFLFQNLGINTVRVYSVDNTINHDACMSLYNAAGIYLMLDVNSPLEGQHLNRDEPWTTYNSIYAEHVFRTIEAFGGYENTLGFFSGNELINSDKSAFASAPYIKAITRDMKAYIRAHLKRPIPVGYSAADDIKYRIETATYMACGTDSDGVNDFYSINSYQWCGQQTIQTSGYDTLISQFSNFTLPLFFSEYGCNEVTPRSFGEVAAVYSSQMTPSFSGGLVYEFSQEANNYGLVKISSSGTAQVLADYNALQSRFAGISGLPTDIAGTQASAKTCPAPSSYTYINGSLAVPSLSEIQVLIKSGVSQTPGTLSSSVPLTQATNTILDVNGAVISNKAIKSASSSGSVGANLKTLFGTNTGTASLASATGKVASAARGSGTVEAARAATTGTQTAQSLATSVAQGGRGLLMAGAFLCVSSLSFILL